MVHGQKDEVVPVSYSRKVLKIFQNAKKKLLNNKRWRSQFVRKKMA